MKAIMISVRPQWVAKILNGEKTIEIRKKFPKDYVGWVYIYVTKGKQNLFRKWNGRGDTYYCSNERVGDCIWYKGNGKVVARFWCDKVEYIENYYDEWRDGEEDYRTETLNPNKLYEKSCLPFEEMDKYLQGDYGYAIHINDLEIFDKPKELWQFKTPENAEKYKRELEQARKEDLKIMRHIEEPIDMEYYGVPNCVELTELSEGYYGLTRAPQSYCFIEIGE